MGEAVKIGALAALANWIVSRWKMAEGSLGISHAALQVQADQRIAALKLLIDMISVIVGTKTTEGSSDFINKRWQQQVVLNLIMNGIDASKTLADRSRELVVATQNGNPGQVHVIVRDFGIGLDEQSRERVFNAFYSTKPGGMGMGLSISRSIVSDHGGQLRIRENEGPGSVFQFSIRTFK
jgi:signal transduction histidine kinase